MELKKKYLGLFILLISQFISQFSVCMPRVEICNLTNQTLAVEYADSRHIKNYWFGKTTIKISSEDSFEIDGDLGQELGLKAYKHQETLISLATLSHSFNHFKSMMYSASLFGFSFIFLRDVTTEILENSFEDIFKNFKDSLKNEQEFLDLDRIKAYELFQSFLMNYKIQVDSYKYNFVHSMLELIHKTINKERKGTESQKFKDINEFYVEIVQRTLFYKLSLLIDSEEPMTSVDFFYNLLNVPALLNYTFDHYKFDDSIFHMSSLTAKSAYHKVREAISQPFVKSILLGLGFYSIFHLKNSKTKSLNIDLTKEYNNNLVRVFIVDFVLRTFVK